MRELPGGTLELTLRLGALVEVEQWILSWGASAEAISPPELRASIRQTATALARTYET
jgi:proteasome accessory factor B